MNRLELIETVTHYQGDAEEEIYRTPILDLLRARDNCFYRDCFDPGHITGSGLLLDATGQRILLNHHKSLNIWVCFGGHADGEENIRAVAEREVQEESGITGIKFVSPEIFDIDVHVIPPNPRKGEPEHRHFDITYLFQTTGNDDFTLSDESHNLRWCDLPTAQQLSPPGRDRHMDRMFRKWSRLYL